MQKMEACCCAGIKEDLQKSKEGYNPNGVGNAYSHNFLNQVNRTLPSYVAHLALLRP